MSDGKSIPVLIVLALLLLTLRGGDLPLTDPDESRCALVVQSMLHHGKWLVPELEGEPYYDKPAPYFWLAAAGTWVTGSVELGGRIVSVLAGVGAVLATFAFARRIGGEFAGLCAGVVLAASPGFDFIGRWYRMDMPLAAFMWAALWWFWRYEGRAVTRGERLARWVGLYAFSAGATLMKGPAGLALPAMIVGGYLLLCGRWRRVIELASLPGIAVYLLLAAPYFLAASLHDPRYFHEFFVVQHLHRFAGGTEFHGGPFPGIAYVAILFGAMMPWAVYLPGAAVRTFPRRWRARAERPEAVLLWLAVLLPLVLFAFSSKRMANYILPSFPPAAVLMGLVMARWAESTEREALFRHGARALGLSVIFMAALLLAVELHLKWLDAWAGALVGAVAAGAWGMWGTLRSGRRRAFLAWGATATTAVLLYAILHTMPRAYERYSVRGLALVVRREVRSAGVHDAKFCYWTHRQFSFALYSGAPEVERFVYDPGYALDRERLAALMNSSRPVYCLVSGEEEMAALRNACPGPISVIARQDRYAVVTNRGAPPSTTTAPAPEDQRKQRTSSTE